MLIGTIPDDKEVLNKVLRGTDITLLRISSIFAGRLNGPAAFAEFKLETWVSISAGVIGNK